MNFSRFAHVMVVLFLASFAGAQESMRIGLFEAHADIGDTPRKGSVVFDLGSKTYRVTGGGANMWSTVDAFQFAWRRVAGDFVITADVRFEGKGAADHRKAVLIARTSLEPNSAYADVALHGDGLTALQFRPVAGAETSEVRSAVNGPVRLRLERRGAQFYMSVGKPGDKLVTAEPATVVMEGPIYLGIGVCSHDANVLETAVFSNVSIEETASTKNEANPARVRSKITVYDLASNHTSVIFSDGKLWEAPNWSPDGKYLIANSGGVIYRFALDRSPIEPEKLALDRGYECNNDKAISPDGKWLAFSAEQGSAEGSQVFLAGADGRSPRLMTPNTPSYFHGWSPDGKWLAFVAERSGNFDIYRVAAAGGGEERLTSSPGFDDGPDYSPDGKWIYINSDRAGGWDIWRFPASGAGTGDAKAERVTGDAEEDWFPHPSPDGKWLVFLSFPPGTKGHDFKTAVQLRVMAMPSSDAGVAPPKDEDAIRTLTQFFGGQGTINVNSWSPDSKKFAFVSYEALP